MVAASFRYCSTASFLRVIVTRVSDSVAGIGLATPTRADFGDSIPATSFAAAAGTAGSTRTGCDTGAGVGFTAATGTGGGVGTAARGMATGGAGGTTGGVTPTAGAGGAT